MDNQYKSNEGMGLGIAGLILGIMSIPLSLIGCTFISGAVLGILGISFSAIGYSQAKKANAQTGLIMAGLIVSIIGFSFAVIRFSNRLGDRPHMPWRVIKEKIEHYEDKATELEDAFEKEFEKELGSDLESILKELEEELEDELDGIEKDIEIELEELENLGEDIEEAFEGLTDEEKAKKLGKAAGRVVREFIDEVKDTNDADKKDN